ncbi:hypothetical protein CLF_101109 [Clonorchis sinensis]|uniref:Reverse transcriptase domain-containing protein n=1 Tax=Clonorchis sinensis TaxID=79923 RepID=G7Y505_CLOSI|nr:hypothetical protein CLF_101109 [Clonorchis sinensis]
MFIMALDKDLGYQSHDNLVDGFAFAGDYVVCAENQARLEEKLDAAAVELRRTGMKIIARKTKAIVIFGIRKHWTTAVSVEPFCFAKELISPLDPTDTVAYLDIFFTLKRRTFSTIASI